jgi:DNA-binding XRE family transcriptional regulator
MTVQIVEIAGQKIAMLPIEDYQRLTEAAEDRDDIQAAIDAEQRASAGEEYVPAYVVDQMLVGKSALYAWRKYRKVTLEDLGDRVGCSHSHLSNVERGLKAGSFSLWRKLATELHLSLDDLVPED